MAFRFLTVRVVNGLGTVCRTRVPLVDLRTLGEDKVFKIVAGLVSACADYEIAEPQKGDILELLSSVFEIEPVSASRVPVERFPSIGSAMLDEDLELHFFITEELFLN